MTDPPGTPGDDRQDIRRPLDESLPSGSRPEDPSQPGAEQEPLAEQPAADPEHPVALRPAAPTDPAPDRTDPAGESPETAPAPEPEPEPAGPARTWAAAWTDRLARAAGAAQGVPVRAARAVTDWTSRPSGRFALPGLLIAALLGIAISTGAFLVPAGRGADPTPPLPGAAEPSGPPLPTVPPTAAPPLNTPGSVPTGQGNPAESLTGWAEQMSARTGIPMLALRAYGYAELAATATTPGCQLSWTTLAAIGRVESNHGSSGGATLLPDGRALPPIFGLPLDGGGDRARILDTDGGALDSDPTYDRAVGPMQFIPSTWALEAVDATGDGVADPHNIHDAALAAANYLCRGGRDLTTATDWWNAVLAYNAVQTYAQAVFAAADEYGRQSQTGGS